MTSLISASQNGCEIKVYDDCGSALWVYGQEFGPTMVISASSWEAAYGIAVDESGTIEHDDLPEAYGFYIMQACKWSETDSKAPYYICCEHDEYGGLTSERILHCNGDRRTIGGPFDDRESAIAYCLEFVSENEIDLVEGYRYQDNSTDTGIVNVGHNEWLERLTDYNLNHQHDDRQIVVVVKDDE
jgi:hypothetical protein